MFDKLRQTYYLPHMANNVYTTIAQCESCVRSGRRYRHKRNLQLFSASGPLDLGALDLPRPLSKTRQGNQYICLITDRYSKLMRAISTFKTSETHMADIFVDYWVVPFGIPTYLLMDNGPQFVGKFLTLVCGHLGVEHLTKTAYHPQTNDQAKRFNRTLVTSIRHSVANHQRDWDMYVHLLTYAYNKHVHRSTNASPYSVVLSEHPSELSLMHAMFIKRKIPQYLTRNRCVSKSTPVLLRSEWKSIRICGRAKHGTMPTTIAACKRHHQSELTTTYTSIIRSRRQVRNTPPTPRQGNRTASSKDVHLGYTVYYSCERKASP